MVQAVQFFEPAPSPEPAIGTPTPRIRLSVEKVLVDRGTLLASDYEEVEAPVIELSFRYGSVLINAADTSDRFFLSDQGGLFPVLRSAADESRARRLLESFGAVDFEDLEDHSLPVDSAASYLLKVSGDVHQFCSFTAYAVPQLRRLGFEVELDPSYPYQLVGADADWYADVEAGESSDWFSLELGVDIGGRKVSLLPALLELLETCSDGQSLERLTSRSKFMALPVGSEGYVPVPGERIRHLILVLKELYAGRRGRRDALVDPDGTESRILVRRGQEGVLGGLDDAFDSEQHPLRWKAPAELRARIDALSDDAERTRVDAPVGLRATLRPYQQEGLAWMQHLRRLGLGGVLADDMGLGKTLQTISHIATEKTEGRLTAPCLVVAPTSLVFNWEREIKKFAPHLSTLVLHGGRRREKLASVPKTDVVITTYGLVQREAAALEQHEYHLVVLDEAQAIKTCGSQAGRAVRRLRARSKLCLTGTPVENNLSELWSLFDFLMPGLLGTAEWFKARFRTPIENGSEEQLQLLRRRVSPFILRRMKNDVIGELPPKTILMRPVHLDAEQRDLYEAIRVAAHAEVRQAIRRKGLAGSTVAVLDALMKLRQVCCDPRLLKVDAALRVRRSAKYEALLEMVRLQVEQGRRVLVFSQFTSMLSLIGRGLDEHELRYVSITGATQNRGEMVDAFQRGEADVFLISLKAGGTGLNLTRADTVIHYDPWWNPAAQSQATDRAYRMGQKNPVFVHNLIVAGSVEERMLRLQQRKQQLADSVLGDAATGAQALLEEDVEDLLAPLDD